MQAANVTRRTRARDVELFLPTDPCAVAWRDLDLCFGRGCKHCDAPCIGYCEVCLEREGAGPCLCSYSEDDLCVRRAAPLRVSVADATRAA